MESVWVVEQVSVAVVGIASSQNLAYVTLSSLFVFYLCIPNMSLS